MIWIFITIRDDQAFDRSAVARFQVKEVVFLGTCDLTEVVYKSAITE